MNIVVTSAGWVPLSRFSGAGKDLGDAMLEKIAEYFYDPLVFWFAPLVLVTLLVVWRRVRAWGLRYIFGISPGNGPGDSS